MDAARVEEVIGDYLTLKKRGANFITLCPFHNEKTPSFTVSPEKGIYKCFGCGKSGNAVSFVMEHEHFSYPEALRHLAQKYSIVVEETQDSPQAKEEREEADSLFIINQFAKDYFTRMLTEDDEGIKIGASYFKERGFRDNTIEAFGLGYCPDKKDSFTEAALKKQYKIEYLETLGLSKTKYNHHYDFFRGRVIFPIHNISGKVIAFAGRTLKQESKTAKYINSQESPLYHKSKILYALHLARRPIMDEDECLIVEGYTDVISMHQAGITNVVASSGTALTIEQIRLIARYTKNITILFDGDEAGLQAAFRGIDMILEQDMNVKIVLLEKEEDPDSMVNRMGNEAFSAFIQDGKSDFVIFKTNLLLKQVQDDPVKKAGLIKEIVGTIAGIPDSIKSALYIKECSRLMDVEEHILMGEYNRVRRQAFSKTSLHPGSDEQETLRGLEEIQLPELHQPAKLDNEVQEKEIIRVLLEYGSKMLNKEYSVVEYILREVTDIELNNATCAAIVNEYKVHFERGATLESAYFTNHEDAALSSMCIDLLTSRHELSKNWYKKYDIVLAEREDNFMNDVFRTIAYIKLFKMNRLIQEHDKKLLNVASLEEEIHLQQTHQQYIKTKKQIADYLGTVVVK